jgi:hypothetical protein
MKKYRVFILGGAIFAFLALLIPSMALAATHVANTTTFTCDTNAAVRVNVTFLVTNDVDSGTDEKFWALDAFHRSVVVYEESNHHFCAVVTDTQGTFTTISGNSPQWATTGGTVSASVLGTFAGGEVETFEAHLRSNPVLSPTGFLGTMNYQCPPTPTSVCLNKFDWLSTYFDEVNKESLDIPVWGWTYHTACNDANGFWVDASTGNAGDITGAPTTCVTPTPVTPTPVTPTPTPIVTPVPPGIPTLPNTGSDPRV